ncbi:hypothetical protein PPL_11735 [Heterostelium album PN500]|uniref:Uncharacterized protein n=1 Tax=Heterostelium pallidum (strain ATCC 26659 / Pp 5 / PN500) TaxID=670386 RepID=D3BUB6_HETP5|nr:hypothetical protein PPL_11735 [Heterostelium album PN500]EFA75050.1 hypothetical protein PPL_11735 [Heterostelium album PN500]|eukprot:XP_020427184.1 hypothetical protein PPL_11735 [Heterostelium album PN500]
MGIPNSKVDSASCSNINSKNTVNLNTIRNETIDYLERSNSICTWDDNDINSPYLPGVIHTPSKELIFRKTSIQYIQV